jgi:7,8-dihydropterin-6-yl-methyl-4-(beta-D-ribofuranosyl)aminobenzene 5'-phosphate synthase
MEWPRPRAAWPSGPTEGPLAGGHRRPLPGLLTGCGHAGIVNTVDYARKTVRPAALHAAVGGFHLFQLDDERLDWTADKLKEDGVENLVGAHCTGLEAVYRMRARLGLSRALAVVGAVGATFELGKGIDPLLLAR